ncbi:MAG: aldolase catalytic domain-containing protein [Candidatus Latescibacterota bacterium]|nr:aldolase catalytic domain-containing protein [Candidatus Latescibacterota bacterium]
MTDQAEHTAAERWLSYREEIKVLDATIRDGGLMNDHQFDDKVVRGVYNACVAAGVDYMEIGYINSRTQFPSSEFGPWKHCVEEDVRRIVGDNNTGLKLSAMADAEKSDYETDILPKSESALDMIRVATYIHQIPLALRMIQDAHDKGYETTANLMAVSTVQERELDEAIEMLVASPVGALYVVDSFGFFYSEQIDDLVEKHLKAIEGTGKEVGIHCHNNRQLAFANTVQALIKGVNYLDASIAGLGRGAGNCQLELLLSFLHNPKYHLRPVLECTQNHIEPLRDKLMWGFDYPYMLTGVQNEHPRSGMAFNASKDRGNIVKFYDEIMAEE